MPSDQDSFELAVAVQTLAARQAVLSIALREVLGALTADQAARSTANVRHAVEEFIQARPVIAIPQADEALAEELAAVLDALRRP